MQCSRCCPAIMAKTKEQTSHIPLKIIRRLLKILIRQKYFPINSLQIIKSLQLWILVAFSLEVNEHLLKALIAHLV